MTTMTFEELDRIDEELPRLNRRQRTAFAAACAERVLPIYERYAGTTAPCGAAINLVALGHKLSVVAVKRPFKAARDFKALGRALAQVGADACARALLAAHWDRALYELAVTQSRRVEAYPGSVAGRALKAVAKRVTTPNPRNDSLARKALASLPTGGEELARVLDCFRNEAVAARARRVSAALVEYADEDVKEAYRRIGEDLIPWLLDGVDTYVGKYSPLRT
jgi:hypothetical protein